MSAHQMDQSASGRAHSAPSSSTRPPLPHRGIAGYGLSGHELAGHTPPMRCRPNTLRRARRAGEPAPSGMTQSRPCRDDTVIEIHQESTPLRYCSTSVQPAEIQRTIQIRACPTTQLGTRDSHTVVSFGEAYGQASTRIVDTTREAIKHLTGPDRVVTATIVALQRLQSDPLARLMRYDSRERMRHQLASRPRLRGRNAGLREFRQR